MQRIIAGFFGCAMDVARDNRQPVVFRLRAGDLNEAGRCSEGMSDWIGAECSKIDARFADGTYNPIALEGGSILFTSLEKVLYPFRLGFSSGILIPESQKLCQPGEYPVVGVRSAGGCCDAQNQCLLSQNFL